MNRFYDLRLVHGATSRKKSNKIKQETDNHDLFGTKLKKNNKKRFFLDTEIEVTISKATEGKTSRVSRRSSKSPNLPRSIPAEKTCGKTSNLTADYCEINSRAQNTQPQESYQIKKRKLSIENGKSTQLRLQSKNSLNVDNFSGISFTSNNRERKNIKKTKKRKIHHMFWESNLTGARRVSKRLTNLKLKKKSAADAEKFTDKYMFTRSLQKTSDEEKKSRVQKSVPANVLHNKCKRNRKTMMSKSTPSLNHSNQPYKYQLRNEKRPHPITLTSSMLGAVVVLQKNLDPIIDTTSQFMEVSDDCFEPKSVVQNSVHNSEKVDSTISTPGSPFPPALETSVEEISSSSCDQDKELNKDLQPQDAEGAHEVVETNDVLINDSECVVENTAEIVFLDDVQEVCEANTEIILVDVETAKNISSDTEQKFEDSTSSEHCKENHCNEEESTDLEKEPSIGRFVQENFKTVLEQNTNHSIKKSVDLQTTSCSSESVMDTLPVESSDQENKEPLENVLLQ